jgi:Fic family protein
LIVSNDTIMKPPYEVTSTSINLISAISEKIGVINTLLLQTPNPTLRKRNQIKTIHASLQIEGNQLSEDQVTAILEGKAVIGSIEDITEVENAIGAYQKFDRFKFSSEKSFLEAHQLLMLGLATDAGKYRKTNVGIAKGKEIKHIAPPAANVPTLMKSLFNYLKNDSDLALIKSCVFHYELEFIHPFSDGNGRMGRLWQNVILADKHPVFKTLPIESIIAQKQSAYYEVLSECDKNGKSTLFIQFMLDIINQALDQSLNTKGKTISQTDRLLHFAASTKASFTRKDYMEAFKTLSTASASRDLQKGVELSLFKKSGIKNSTIYSIIAPK